MAEPGERVRLRDIARGMLAAAPDAPRAARGLLRLATLRPDSRRSVGAEIARWARLAPDAPALRFAGRTWTWRAFDAWSNRIAHALAGRGIGHGACVGLLMPNRPELLATVAAVVKLGAVAGMLNPNQRGEQLAHAIDQIDPQLLVVDAELAGHLDGLDLAIPVLCWEGPGGLDAEQAGQHDAPPAAIGRVRAREPCFHIFTSGTTGLPKASVMTHYRWLAAMSGVGAATLRIRRDDVLYVCLPLYHNNALTVSWSAAMSAGACIALDERFSASTFWQRVRECRATAFCYIGEMLRYLLNQPPGPGDRDHRVRLIVGNGLRPELWAAFEQRFGITRIYEFYGASESNIAFVNAFGVPRTAGFTPLEYAIVEYDHDRQRPVRDARGRMRRVARGGVGLLIARVDERHPFDGYTDPQATERRLLRDVFEHGDLWYDSGDLVRDQGWRHIAFVDRVGDGFRWKGENVSAREVERVLGRQPGIAHAVVYGVAVPGAEGRAGMAALALADGTRLDGPALAAALRAALPAYAVPRFLRLCEPDTTGTFKYRKGDLQRDGFDPARIRDPLYYLAEDGYRVLDAAAHAAILAGSVRL